MLRKRTMLASLIEDGGGNDANCILLLHLDNNRTNASSSGITVSQYNSIPFTTTYKKFGTHALNCTSAYYYLSSSTAINNALTNEITVDYWIKVNQSATDQYNMGYAADFSFGGSGGKAALCVVTYTGRFICTGWANGDVNFLIDLSYTWGSGFNHVAVVIKGGTVKAFINGILVGSTVTILSLPISETIHRIAGGYSTMHYTGGGLSTTNVMDEFRISNCARWTKNFTPPTSAYI